MFEGLRPSTAATCESLIVTRFRQYLRSAISAARRNDRKDFYRYMGIAEGQIAVLYDFNNANAYRYLSAIRRLQKRVDGVTY